MKIYQDTFTQLHHPGNNPPPIIPTRPWLGWATLKCSPTTPVLYLLVLTIYLGIPSNKKKYKKLIENDQLKLIYSTEVMYLCMFSNVTKISTRHEIEMCLLSHFVTEFSKCHRISGKHVLSQNVAMSQGIHSLRKSNRYNGSNT